ncbi:hypothetical protein NPIL_169371 [Nephila pilipes]|uniref:Uncharacterized protein n=1 Tax=Nephila pilipes TaxID=299642 RepID=A0A8X6UAB2_NEPPI|nr:hypothetical protein NPIL_169371 [Nephila pilipes]
MNGKEYTISINKLKPAHLVTDLVDPSNVSGSTSTGDVMHKAVGTNSGTTIATYASNAATAKDTMHKESTVSSDSAIAASTPRTRTGHCVHFSKRY